MNHIKMCIANVIRRKYKNIVLIAIFCVLISYNIFINTRSNKVIDNGKTRSGKVNSKINLEYVTVHLDLKGSPPKMDYLLSLLHTLQYYGANSILLEYEDMFPFEGSIVNLSAVYHYTKHELIQFIKRAKNLEMEIIPLVQTFGHMEYALKLKEFAHLRENRRQPGSICPSNNMSIELITNMLTQVIKLHTPIMPLRHIHIGCDEVQYLNQCSLCKKRVLDKNTLFMDHVQKVTAIVRKLSPGTKVLIWPDMILENKKSKKHISFDNIEAVWWDYRQNLRWLSHTVAYNLHHQFADIWVASAFKGADGKKAVIPNIKNRYLNNLGWLKFIYNYKFGGENKVYDFKGIILTGWSRYSHMSVQCELLPVAMPSLLLNLMLIRTLRGGIEDDFHKIDSCKFFDKYLKSDFEDIFQTLPSHDQKDHQCSFEKTKLYKEFHKVFDFNPIDTCLEKLRTSCQLLSSSEPKGLHDLQVTCFLYCNSTLKGAKTMSTRLESFMKKYYRTGVINSYINERIRTPQAEIEHLLTRLNSKHNKLYWTRRH
nr:hexosaminidase D [Helicoverpa armigera]